MDTHGDDDVLSFLGEGDGEEVEDQVMPGIEELEVLTVTMPSMNEIRLGRKVLDLEKERDELSAELERMKVRYPSHHPTIPVPTEPSTPAPPITIPHNLLPTLNLLRHHIAELTRDNEALRYTFLGEPSSSKVTLDTPVLAQPTGETGMYRTAGLDPKAVVKRVREVMRENEELGEMILKAGRGNGPEWQKAIDDSKAVIDSLESDLAHHLKVVQTVRAELIAYKTHFGPIPKPSAQSTAVVPPTPPVQPVSSTGDAPKLSRTGSISISGLASRQERPRDSDRHRHRDRGRDRDKEKDKDKDKERSEKGYTDDRRGDRDKESSSRDYRKSGSELSGGIGGNDHGSSRGSDRDRDYKRRR